jgi:hypothetical protein
MPGSFPADVSGEDVELAGGGGAGAAFDITAVSEPNTTLADIPNPAPNDFAFVLEDETHDGKKWRYSNLDYNGDGIYNWVPVIELGDTGRDFTADPLTAGELATNAVTETKIAEGAVTLAKQADVSLTGITADTADFAAEVSGSFAQVLTSMLRKTRGLFSSTVKKTGNETIAGVKTFSAAPVIPALSTLPSSPSGTRPATEAQALDAAIRKTATINEYPLNSGTIVYDEQGRAWHPNYYSTGTIKGSVLSNGRSGAGSRCELDLYVQFNLLFEGTLAAGSEAVFLSNPIELWNVNSALTGGTVGIEWLADNSALEANSAGYKWSSPTPLLVDDYSKFSNTSKIFGNMLAGMVSVSGGNGIPGRLYGCGGFRVFEEIEYPVIFFTGHMRIGLTRA